VGVSAEEVAPVAEELARVEEERVPEVAGPVLAEEVGPVLAEEVGPALEVVGSAPAEVAREQARVTEEQDSAAEPVGEVVLVVEVVPAAGPARLVEVGASLGNG